MKIGSTSQYAADQSESDNCRSLFCLTLLFLFTLCACSGGGNTTEIPSTSVTKSFSAGGEAHRMATLYRPLRDISNVLLQYAQSSDRLKSLDGRTTPCLRAGSVTTTYDPGPGSDIEQGLQVIFNDCQESVGLITGSFTILWNASDDKPSSGTFTPTFSGTFAVDGVSYSVDRPSLISLSYNMNSGYRSVYISVKSLSGMQGPTGAPLSLKQQQWTLIDDPTAASYQITNSFSDITNAGGPEADWRDAGTFTVERLPGSAAVTGIGFPQSGGFNYFRSLRSGMLEPISGDQTFQAGLVNVAVHGSQTQLSDGGQFDWASLFATAIYDMDGQ